MTTPVIKRMLSGNEWWASFDKEGMSPDDSKVSRAVGVQWA
jgi:hypothetical protein